MAIENHRCEVIVLDLESKEFKTIDRNEFGFNDEFHWSPDGRWLTYSINRDSGILLSGIVKKINCAYSK